MDLKRARSLYLRGDLDGAEPTSRAAVEADPHDAAAVHLLGLIARKRGRTEEAASLLRRAAELRPTDPNVQIDYALPLVHLGKNADAVGPLQAAIQSRPDSARAHGVLGAALVRLGRRDEAERILRRAIELNPGHAKAHHHLGTALQQAGQLDDAVAMQRRSLELKPGYIHAARGLSSALGAQGRGRELVDANRRVVAMRGSAAFDHSNLLFTLHYDPRPTLREIYEAARAFAARRTDAGAAAAAAEPLANDRSPDRRLRVGYITTDFREHPIGRLIEPVLACHDRSAFEVVCYSDSAPAAADKATEHLRGLADLWRDTYGMSDADVADRVREDRTDVLVELNGHFGGNRLLMFARRAAPVQVSHFGYCDTTGAAGMDYRVTDALSDPPGTTERYHTERLVRIPGASWCYRPWGETPDVGPLPADIRGYVTFGNLNNPVKTCDAAAATWAAILARVPGSRLLMLGPKGSEPYVIRRFAALGVEPWRLVLVNGVPRQVYLNMYNQFDVGLDPFPFNGDNTTCDGFWMGVPAVSLAGNAFWSRRGVSHLTNVGLPDLVANSVADYVDKAVSLASDLPRLAGLRRTLRGRLQASPLGDAPAFVRKLEAAYRGMWRTWCATPA